MSKYSLEHIASVGGSYYLTGSALYIPSLIQSILSSNGKKKLTDFYLNGVLTQTIEQLIEFIQTKGAILVVEKEAYGDYVFAWKDHSFINIDFRKKEKTITITGFTTDPKLFSFVPDMEKDFVSKVKKNIVFTIVQTSSGFSIKSLGDGSSPLFRDNYNPEVLEEVDFVIESFGKKPPNGRICIFNGEPGTGKTHLIRSMLMQMDCVFLIVPSNLISSLDKPEFIPMLVDVKTEHEKSIIMIIEDGDACLVPRKNDNISTITSLLNLSDGILGAMIDVKMIISTNANIHEMDEAIMRPGRLCRNIHVGSLPYERANLVYQRLKNDPEVKLDLRKSYTLAEVYDKFNNVGTVPVSSSQYSGNRRVLGFSIDPVEERQPATLNKNSTKDLLDKILRAMKDASIPELNRAMEDLELAMEDLNKVPAK